MSLFQLASLKQLPVEEQTHALSEINQQLDQLSAIERVTWALEHLPKAYVLSSSFGIQAAVCLHLITRQYPDIPVVLTDTGYLFPETYQFIDTLTEQLQLNLKVYRAEISSSWQEARYGKLWLEGIDGIERYNQINKVEPMERALKTLQAQTWFAGLRRQQAKSREHLPVLSIAKGIFKFLPIVDWDNKQVYQYLKENGLPYHPLWEQGYLSVGDTHTTRKWEEGMSEEETRECGLHE